MKNLLKTKNYSKVFKSTNAFSKRFYQIKDKSLLDKRLTREEILAAPSTPIISPSYPFGPYSFYNREYLIITYETDEEDLKRVVPYPLKPAGNLVLYEWINMPDSTGFGSYTESGTVIPVINTKTGELCNYTMQMYLDDEPPISCGREVWGFPKKFARPKIETMKDTLVGVLTYSGIDVAVGTMGYKYKRIPNEEAKKSLLKTQINLKLIPGVDKKKPDLYQLVGYNLEDVEIKEAWESPARLQLRPHINAPTNLLPIKKIIGGKHILANLKLPYGRVLHDYLKEEEEVKPVNRFDWSIAKEEPSKLDFSNREDVLKATGMPIVSPSFSPSIDFELNNREHFICRYRSDPEVIARNVPEPLIPNEESQVVIIFTKTEGSGLAKYSKCELFIPCYYQGEQVLFEVQGYADSSAARTTGRELYGQPLKIGQPSIEVQKDTIVANFKYSGLDVVSATMAYHYGEIPEESAEKFLLMPQVNLKLVPSCQDGKIEIAYLTKIVYSDVNVTEAYSGPVQLELMPHINAPFSDFPVLEILKGSVIKADLTIKGCRILHDYIKDKSYDSGNII